MLQKIKNWPMSILVIIVSIFSLALVQQQAIAEWTPPPTQPGDGDPVHFVTDPLDNDLDLGGFRLEESGLDFRLDPNADIGLKLRGTTSIEAIGKHTGIMAIVDMDYCSDPSHCTALVAGGAGVADTYTGVKGMTGSGIAVEGYVGQDGGIAILGKMADATPGWAGYFDGDLNVTGNLCFDGSDCIDDWADVGGGGGADGYIGDSPTAGDTHISSGHLDMSTYNIYVNTNHGYLFGAGDSGMYAPINAGEIAFKTNDIERIRIDDSGNVGIGTNNPNNEAKLHVFSDTFNAEIAIQSVAGAGNHWGIYNYDNTNDLRFWRGDDQVTFTSTGRVGIGTTAPAVTLDVKGDIIADHIGIGAIIDSAYRLNIDGDVQISSDIRVLDDIFVGDDLDFYGDLKPEGLTCAPNDILQKVAPDEWACASLAGGGDTDWVETGGNVYRAIGNVGINTTTPSYSLETSGEIYTSTHLFSDAWYGTTGNGGAAQNLWIGDNNDTIQIQGELAVAGNASAADPTQNQHLATKAYVDAQAGGSRPTFYSTPTTHQGDTALTACDPGYHMCTGGEWFGSAYNFVLGTQEIPTSNWYNSTVNLSSCEHWTSNANNRYGSYTYPDTSNSGVTGWLTKTARLCNNYTQVLCCSD